MYMIYIYIYDIYLCIRYIFMYTYIICTELIKFCVYSPTFLSDVNCLHTTVLAQ